jgi:hypothetical protein
MGLEAVMMLREIMFAMQPGALDRQLIERFEPIVDDVEGRRSLRCR